MVDLLVTVSFFAIIGLFAYGFYMWIEKIEIEKEYLQSLLKGESKKK